MCFGCTIDYDRHLDHLLMQKERDEEMELSSCCNAEIVEDSDVCSECGEHCISVGDAHIARLEDEADARYQQKKDEE